MDSFQKFKLARQMQEQQANRFQAQAMPPPGVAPFVSRPQPVPMMPKGGIPPEIVQAAMRHQMRQQQPPPPSESYVDPLTGQTVYRQNPNPPGRPGYAPGSPVRQASMGTPPQPDPRMVRRYQDNQPSGDLRQQQATIAPTPDYITDVNGNRVYLNPEAGGTLPQTTNRTQRQTRPAQVDTRPAATGSSYQPPERPGRPEYAPGSAARNTTAYLGMAEERRTEAEATFREAEVAYGETQYRYDAGPRGLDPTTATQMAREQLGPDASDAEVQARAAELMVPVTDEELAAAQADLEAARGAYAAADAAVAGLGGDLEGSEYPGVFGLLDLPRQQTATQYGEYGYQIATGEAEGMSQQSTLPGGVPMVDVGAGVAAVSDLLGFGPGEYESWVNDNKDYVQQVYTQGYDSDGDGTIDFTGGRAVWEAFIATQGIAARIAYDALMDPLNYLEVVGGAGGALRTAGRGARTGTTVSLRNNLLGRAAEATGAVLQTPTRILDEPVDAVIGGALEGAGRVVRAVPGVGRGFNWLTSQTQQSLIKTQADDLGDTVGGATARARGEGPLDADGNPLPRTPAGGAPPPTVNPSPTVSTNPVAPAVVNPSTVVNPTTVLGPQPARGPGYTRGPGPGYAPGSGRRRPATQPVAVAESAPNSGTVIPSMPPADAAVRRLERRGQRVTVRAIKEEARAEGSAVSEVDAVGARDRYVSGERPTMPQNAPEPSTSTIPPESAVVRATDPAIDESALPRWRREPDSTTSAPWPARPGRNAALNAVREQKPEAWSAIMREVGDEAEALADTMRRAQPVTGDVMGRNRPAEVPGYEAALAEGRYRANLNDAVRRNAGIEPPPQTTIRQPADTGKVKGGGTATSIAPMERILIGPWSATTKDRQGFHVSNIFENKPTQVLNRPEAAARYVEAVDLHARLVPDDLTNPAFLEDVAGAARIRQILVDNNLPAPDVVVVGNTSMDNIGADAFQVSETQIDSFPSATPGGNPYTLKTEQGGRVERYFIDTPVGQFQVSGPGGGRYPWHIEPVVVRGEGPRMSLDDMGQFTKERAFAAVDRIGGVPSNPLQESPLPSVVNDAPTTIDDQIAAALRERRAAGTARDVDSIRRLDAEIDALRAEKARLRAEAGAARRAETGARFQPKGTRPQKGQNPYSEGLRILNEAINMGTPRGPMDPSAGIIRNPRAEAQTMYNATLGRQVPGYQPPRRPNMSEGGDIRRWRDRVITANEGAVFDRVLASGKTAGDTASEYIDEFVAGGLDEEQAGVLAVKRILDEELAAAGLSPSGRKGFGYLWDTFSGALKAAQLYNVATGLRFVMTNFLGNPVTLMLARNPEAAFRALNVKNLKTMFKYVRGETSLPEATTTILREFQIGRAPGSVLKVPRDTAEQGQIALLTRAVRRIGLGDLAPITDGLTGIVNNRFIRDLATAADYSARLTLWTTQMERRLPEQFAQLADDAVERATRLGIDADPVRQAVAAAGDIGVRSANRLDTLRTEMLRQAQAGGLSQGASHDFADRVLRDAIAASRRASDLSRQEVRRVLFSAGETNLDYQLGRIVFFHFWSTRASALYAREAIRMPGLANAYLRGIGEMKERAEAADAPPWLRTWYQLAGTPFGLAVALNPYALISTSFLAGEDSEGQAWWNPMRYTMLNPALDLAFYAVGGLDGFREFLTGSKPTMTPQIPGVAAVGRLVTAAVNAAGSYLDEDGEVFYDPTRRIIPEALDRVGLGRGGDPNASERQNFTSLVAQEGRERGYSEEEIIAAMDNPDDPAYQAARRELGLGQAATAAWRTVMPLPVQTSVAERNSLRQSQEPTSTVNAEGDVVTNALPYEGWDPYSDGLITAQELEQMRAYRDATGQWPTPELLAEGSENLEEQRRIQNATTAGSPETRQLINQDTQYDALGTESEQRAQGLWTDIAYGPITRIVIDGQPVTEEDIQRYEQAQLQETGDPAAAAEATQQLRFDLADAYLEEQNLTDDRARLQAEREAFLAANPAYRQYDTWRDDLRRADGGVVGWWEDTAQGGNQNAGAYLEWAQSEAGDDTGYLESLLTSPNAFLAVNGDRRSVYDEEPLPTSSGTPPFMAPMASADSGGGSGSSGGASTTDPRVANITEGLAEYEAQQQAVENVLGPDFSPFGEMGTAIMNNRLAAAGVEPAGQNRGMDAEYQEWAAMQPPGADISILAFLAQYDSKRSRSQPSSPLAALGIGGPAPAPGGTSFDNFKLRRMYQQGAR